MFLRRNLMGLIALTVAGIPVLALLLMYRLCRGGDCADDAGVAAGLLILTSPLALILAIVALSTARTTSGRVLAYVSLALSTVMIYLSCLTFTGLG